MMEIESTVLNASCMLIALFIAMGSVIVTYVKAIFYYDYAQSVWGKVLRTAFWLLMGGFGSTIEGICFEKMGYSENNFLTNAFWIVFSVGCVFWLFEILTSHDKEPGNVAAICGRIFLIPILYQSMLYALTTLLQKKIVLSENWMWQLAEILLYYFMTVKIVISIESKLHEVKRGEILKIRTNIENKLHEK